MLSSDKDSGDYRGGPLIPSALKTYRALREDGGDNGKRLKSVLERIHVSGHRYPGWVHTPREATQLHITEIAGYKQTA